MVFDRSRRVPALLAAAALATVGVAVSGGAAAGAPLVHTSVPPLGVLARFTAEAGSTAGRLNPDDSLMRPPWWKGSCDVGNNPAAHKMTAIFDGLQSCAPGPNQGGTDRLVDFFPGAWGEYEWECVELSMRWMYLAWGVKPYGANGNDVVANYPNGTAGYPRLTVERNGVRGLAPLPGDVLSLDDSDGDGHTEVVAASSVDSSGNGTVKVITENWNSQSDGWLTLSVSHWVVSDGFGDTVLGWLHNPAWSVQMPVSWELTSSGDLEIRDTGALSGSYATIATGIAQASVAGGEGFEPTPIVAALTTAGDLEAGYYLPGLPGRSLSLIATGVRSFALSSGTGGDGLPVLAWRTDTGDLEVASGSVTAKPVLEATGVSQIALAQNSGPADPLIGYLSTGGTFYDKEGAGALAPSQPWRTVASGVSSIALAGGDMPASDAIEAFVAAGSFYEREGLTGSFTDEAAGVTSIAAAAVGSLATPLLAYISSRGSLEVKEGAGAFVGEAGSIVGFSIAAGPTSAGFPVLGALGSRGGFAVKDGSLGASWQSQPSSGIASAGVAAVTVS